MRMKLQQRNSSSITKTTEDVSQEIGKQKDEGHPEASMAVREQTEQQKPKKVLLTIRLMVDYAIVSFMVPGIAFSVWSQSDTKSDDKKMSALVAENCYWYLQLLFHPSVPYLMRVVFGFLRMRSLPNERKPVVVSQMKQDLWYALIFLFLNLGTPCILQSMDKKPAWYLSALQILSLLVFVATTGDACLFILVCCALVASGTLPSDAIPSLMCIFIMLLTKMHP